MSWAADGQDGNRLHLEKMRLIVSSLSHLISSSLFSLGISCTTKVL